MMRILNVGCGESQYGTHFIDLYPQRREVIQCDIETQEIPFEDAYFDIVYSENLLEHLRNPNSALREMVRVLKRGGRLDIITDNASFWAFHVPFATTHYGGYEKRSSGEEDRHYVLFTSWHLENHFRSLGVIDIAFEYTFSTDKVPSLLVRLVSRMLRLFSARMAYPMVRISGVKEV